MSVPIIIFHHAVFEIAGEMLPAALDICFDQMEALRSSGLLDAAAEMYCGVNGGQSSKMFADGLLPKKATIVYHGDACRNENRTILMMQDYAKSAKGEAYLFYQHQKGSTHATGSDYASFAGRWRQRMMHHCVTNWRTCVADLDAGFEVACCHWLTGQGWDRSQHFAAGTIYWTKASFLATVPSLLTRQRIKDSGIDSIESRFEAEVLIGNGPRLPRVKDYYSGELGT
jgi:hypothetical protein